MKRKAEDNLDKIEAKKQKFSLFESIKNNNIEGVKEFLASRDQNNKLDCDSDGQDPLIYALSLQHIEIARILIPYANLNAQDRKGDTALHISAYNDIKIAQMLIEANADLNIQNKDGDTALHIAVDYYSIEIVQLLIKSGANLDIQNNMGITVLHNAARLGIDVIVELLVNAKANINIQSNSGKTALHFAIGESTEKTNEAVEKIARALIEANADLNIQNENGDTALHIAVNFDVGDVVKVLVGVEANPTLQNNDGNTALHEAIIYLDNNLCKPESEEIITFVEITEALIKGGSILENVDKKNNNLWQFLRNKLAKEKLISIGQAITLTESSYKKIDALLSQDQYIKIIDNINTIVRNREQDKKPLIYFNDEQIKYAVEYFKKLISSDRVSYENYSNLTNLLQLSNTLNESNNLALKQEINKVVNEEISKTIEFIFLVESQIQCHFYEADAITSTYLVMFNNMKQDKDLSDEDKYQNIDKIIKEAELSLISLLQAKENNLNHIAISVVKINKRNNEQKLEFSKQFVNNIFSLTKCIIINKNLKKALNEVEKKINDYDNNKIILSYIELQDANEKLVKENKELTKKTKIFLDSLNLTQEQQDQLDIFLTSSNNNPTGQDDDSFILVIGDNTHQENIS